MSKTNLLDATVDGAAAVGRPSLAAKLRAIVRLGTGSASNFVGTLASEGAAEASNTLDPHAP